MPGYPAPPAMPAAIPPPTIVVSLDRRQLTLFQHGKKPMRLRASIGAQGRLSPIGEYKILGKYPGSTWGGRYGSAVMTLNVNQPGKGGLPIAIHGTPTQYAIGGRTTAGCFAIRDRPLRRLMQLVPVGTRVVIRGSRPH